MNYNEAKQLLDTVKLEKQEEFDKRELAYFGKVVNILDDYDKQLAITSEIRLPRDVIDSKSGLYIYLRKKKSWFLAPTITVQLPYDYLTDPMLTNPRYNYWRNITTYTFYPDNELEVAKFIVFVGETFNLHD